MEVLSPFQNIAIFFLCIWYNIVLIAWSSYIFLCWTWTRCTCSGCPAQIHRLRLWCSIGSAFSLVNMAAQVGFARKERLGKMKPGNDLCRFENLGSFRHLRNQSGNHYQKTERYIAHLISLFYVYFSKCLQVWAATGIIGTYKCTGYVH